MNEQYRVYYSILQEEDLEILIIRTGSTEKMPIDEAMRNAYLTMENENLRRQLGQARFRIEELESEVDGLNDVSVELASQIPYPNSPYCEACGRGP